MPGLPDLGLRLPEGGGGSQAQADHLDFRTKLRVEGPSGGDGHRGTSALLPRSSEKPHSGHMDLCEVRHVAKSLPTPPHDPLGPV